jgi:hypothetical protein
MGMERMQQWAADHQVLLDAKLAGLRAGLKLTANEETLWGPFEAAVRDAAKLRMEHMRAMMDRMPGMEDDERRSPIDPIEAMATHMSEAALALTKIVLTLLSHSTQAWMNRRNGCSDGWGVNS